jgi:GTP-binding protein
VSGSIAIVGRPNVGKSALFNRIVGQRIAIVHDQPGITRDRITAEAEWRGRSFTLADTGGLGLLQGQKANDVIIKATLEQAQLAVDAAQVIILVADVQAGVVPLDREVAGRLRRAAKPVLVAVNKVDNQAAEPGVAEFAELGFDHVFALSAIHGHGVRALMDAALRFLPEPDQPPATGGPAGPAGPLKLAVVGRQNVGKSSIINALTQSERVIVTPIPGTTRDAVDVPFTVETEGRRQNYLLIDTAGIRKTRRVADSIEFFSVKRAEHSIARADIVIFVLDAQAGILEQDKKVADRIVAARKACIVVVNKWDLVEDQVRQLRLAAQPRRDQHGPQKGPPRPLTTLAEFGSWVQERLFFLDYAPVIFTSAKSGFHLDRLLEAVRYVAAQLQQKIPTALLNRVLHDAIERRQPVSAAGHRLKFFYATQIRQAPPAFLLFVNRDELFSAQYTKYLTDQMRRAFGYEGCPLLLVPKPRPRSVEPKRSRIHELRPMTVYERRHDQRNPAPGRRGNRRGRQASRTPGVAGAD